MAIDPRTRRVIRALANTANTADTADAGGNRRRRIAALCALALIPAGCKSADDYKADADREAYHLVLERRAALKLGDPAFTIEANPDSLRQRMLRSESPGPTALSLVQCLEIAAENSRDYQTQKEALYLSALDLTLARFAFDVHQNGELSALLSGQGDEATTASASATYGLTKLLGSGASIIGSIGLSIMRNLLSSDGWHPTTTISLAATQPLLRGFGTTIVEEPLTQAERNLVYAVRTFERYRRSFAVDAADRYYGVLELRDAVGNQERNVKSLSALTERNTALAEAGRLSKIEVGQAHQNELTSRANLLTAKQNLANALDDLKLFMGLPIEFDLELDPDALTELTKTPITELSVDEHAAISFALGNRLDYLNLVDQVDDSSRKVVVAADALRAGLDINGQITLPSQDGKPGKFDFRDATWSVGAVLDLPLNREAERNTYRKAIVAHAFAQRAEEQSADQIADGLRVELRTTETRRETYKIQLSAVDLAQQRIESTRLNLEAGRTDTRSLLEAEQSLLDAQNAATAALIDYNTSRLALLRDLEILRVDASGIGVDETLLHAVRPDRATQEAHPGPGAPGATGPADAPGAPSTQDGSDAAGSPADKTDA
jgi:outer membrane protein TolC